MARRLLVPLDGSRCREVALPWAVSIARARGFVLVLAQMLRCSAVGIADIPSDHAATSGKHPEESPAPATSYLAGLCARLSGDDLAIETVARRGTPGTIIPRLVDELGARAIVVATHGHSGLTWEAIDDVTEQILAHATVPVLLVQTDRAGRMREFGLKRLLVALDGSRLAERALEAVAELAAPYADAVLVGVSEQAPVAPHASPTGPGCMDRGDPRRAAVEYLLRASRRLPAGWEATTDARLGAPGRQIVAAADAHDADAIVMTTHGEHGPNCGWLGGVADYVVRHATRPVLLVSVRGSVT